MCTKGVVPVFAAAVLVASIVVTEVTNGVEKVPVDHFSVEMVIIGVGLLAEADVAFVGVLVVGTRIVSVVVVIVGVVATGTLVVSRLDNVSVAGVVVLGSPVV